MVGGSARWGRWWSSRSPTPGRRPGPRAVSSSQLLVETDRSCSEPDLPAGAELETRPDAAGAAGAEGGARARTYSLTRLHYSVYLEPDGAAVAAATLPRARPPITIIGEETRVTDDGPAEERKQKRKKKPLRKFLSVENLRKSVRKSKERMQGIDEALRKQARNTLRRMRTDRRGFESPGAAAPSGAAHESTESETEQSPPAGDAEGRAGPETPAQNDVSLAGDSLTTSDEPCSTPVPPELSIEHELTMAEERANDLPDASAAPRPDRELAGTVGRRGGGAGFRGRTPALRDGAMDSASDEKGGAAGAASAEPANGQPPQPGTPPPPQPGSASPPQPGSASPSAPVTDADEHVERAEQAIADQERARHHRPADVADNEVSGAPRWAPSAGTSRTCTAAGSERPDRATSPQV